MTQIHLLYVSPPHQVIIEKQFVGVAGLPTKKLHFKPPQNFPFDFLYMEDRLKSFFSLIFKNTIISDNFFFTSGKYIYIN